MSVADWITWYLRMSVSAWRSCHHSAGKQLDDVRVSEEAQNLDLASELVNHVCGLDLVSIQNLHGDLHGPVRILATGKQAQSSNQMVGDLVLGSCRIDHERGDSSEFTFK